LKKKNADDNDSIIRLRSNSRSNREFREEGEGITSKDKMRANDGKTVLTE
jgi:hypothetical protein